jgi:NADP-dependent 3-hydroxy acid dehydrogenase YdfG
MSSVIAATLLARDTITLWNYQMNLGIEGKTAVVCGASSGLGRACATALAREGVNVVIAARTLAKLQSVEQDIRAQSDVTVTTVACDITTIVGRAALLSSCSKHAGYMTGQNLLLDGGVYPGTF